MHNPFKPFGRSAGVAEPPLRPAPIAYDELTLYLRLLGVPNRLQLLRRLQVPHAVSDIELTAARRSANRDPSRAISRNAIEMHLRRLEEAGLVRARESTRDGRAVREYVTNHARLFTVIEELRRVALLRATRSEATEAADVAEGAVQPPILPRAPALLLVNGPMEGLVFALEGPGPWRVGRQGSADIAIPHDPFVSRESATISRRGERFEISCSEVARNAASLNWAPLAPGETRSLTPGDVVGVGKSLLTFRSGEATRG